MTLWTGKDTSERPIGSIYDGHLEGRDGDGFIWAWPAPICPRRGGR